MEKELKKVSVTIAGTRYEFALEEDFADFILEEFRENEVLLDQDNRPDKLLKAFLKVSKQCFEYDEEINTLIKELE